MYDELLERLYKRIALTTAGSPLQDDLEEAAGAIKELQQTAEHYHGCMNDWFEAAQEYKAAYIAEHDARIAESKPKWIPVTDVEHLPNTDSGVVGYFGGGCFDQLRWYDFVCTLSDGSIVSESSERDVENEHCIAVFKLPEPPKEET